MLVATLTPGVAVAQSQSPDPSSATSTVTPDADDAAEHAPVDEVSIEVGSAIADEGDGPEGTTPVVVTLAPGSDPAATAAEVTAVGSSTVTDIYSAVSGFAGDLTPEAVAYLDADPGVLSVEPDGEVSVQATQQPPSWGLDRVDQSTLPLSGTYSYHYTGRGVTAYVFDTGILAGHSEFGSRVASGYTAFQDGQGTTDCHGHGTHVAGTIGGTTYGVAKEVSLVPVRVLGCDGRGTFSQLIAGIDWVIANRPAGQPAVANISLGGVASMAVDAAIERLIDSGVVVVASAGNDNKDACTASPARAPEAITVGASTRTDQRWASSNWGPCLDLFAPGEQIISASYRSTTAAASMSGTSMAAPHVAGAAAMILQRSPQASPAAVTDTLLTSSSRNRISGAGNGSTTNLLRTLPVGTNAPVPATREPVGNLDAISTTATSIFVRGWALDPDTADPIRVHVYVDGAVVTAVTADRPRPDVGRAKGLGDNHGFNVTVAVTDGSHRVCLYGINLPNGPNPQLACRQVTVRNAAPFGVLDSVRTSAAGVDLTGWALDRDTADPIRVHVYVDGKGVQSIAADRTRTDIERAYGLGAQHGFSTFVPLTAGKHQVCLYLINAPTGANPRLTCRDVTITNAAPIGVLDELSAGAGSVRVRGWAFDTDATAAQSVQVYVDGKFTARVAATELRTDVARAKGTDGLHGFDLSVPVSAGRHQVCVYAMNQPSGTPTTLGCRDLNVN